MFSSTVDEPPSGQARRGIGRHSASKKESDEKKTQEGPVRAGGDYTQQGILKAAYIVGKEPFTALTWPEGQNRTQRACSSALCLKGTCVQSRFDTSWKLG